MTVQAHLYKPQIHQLRCIKLLPYPACSSTQQLLVLQSHSKESQPLGHYHKSYEILPMSFLAKTEVTK